MQAHPMDAEIVEQLAPPEREQVRVVLLARLGAGDVLARAVPLPYRNRSSD
jgi:hypothetical protein